MKKEMFLVEKIASKLRSYKNKADSLLVLGSGWNRVVDELVVEKQWDFAEVFGVGSEGIESFGIILYHKLGICKTLSQGCSRSGRNKKSAIS